MKPELEPTLVGYYPLDGQTLKENGLHLASYKSTGKYLTDGIIAYRVFPDKQMVIYSGLNDSSTWTIHAASQILESLLEEDPSIDKYKFRFFDIGTTRGYDYMRLGQFQIAEVKFNGEDEASIIPVLKPSVLPKEFLSVIPILASP
jgi:hypothetical protein